MSLSIVLFTNSNAASGPPIGCDYDLYPNGCPIDGGASLLVGVGVAYGMKKIRDKKKSKKDLKDTI